MTSRTTLTNSFASFIPGALAGKIISPNILNFREALVISNSQDQIVLAGDMTSDTAGATWRIMDYHISVGSAAIDMGTTASAPLTDLDGNLRPVDIPGVGKSGADTFDIGAYEFQLSDIPPNAPDNAAASAITYSQIVWSWRDNSTNEDEFDIWFAAGATAPSGMETTTCTANTTQWTASGLTTNTLYAFQVAASNRGGDSAKTGNISAATLIEPVAGIVFSNVTSLSISAAPASTVFSNLSAGSSGLFIANATAGGNSGWRQTVAAWDCSGLTPNTLYSFTGKSRNMTSLETPPSLPVTKCTLAATPIAPNVTSPTASTLSVSIAAGDQNPTDTVYAIHISPDVNGVGNQWVQADGSVSASPVWQTRAQWGAITVTSLTEAVTYFIQSRAMNKEGIETSDSKAAFGVPFAQFTLTLAAVHGSILADPQQTTYDRGTTVTLTAAPDHGYYFAGWSGGISVGHELDNPLALVMDSDKSLAANFALDLGTVVVQVNPSTATWSFTDGDGANHPGAGDQMITSVPAGLITLTWGAARGYETPSPNPTTQTLSHDATVTFTAVYPLRYRGTVVVDVTPQDAPWSFVDGDNKTRSGVGPQAITGVPTGLIALTWGELEGYAAPSPNPVSQTLAKDDITTFTGIYIAPLEPINAWYEQYIIRYKDNAKPPNRITYIKNHRKYGALPAGDIITSDGGINLKFGTQYSGSLSISINRKTAPKGTTLYNIPAIKTNGSFSSIYSQASVARELSEGAIEATSGVIKSLTMPGAYSQRVVAAEVGAVKMSPKPISTQGQYCYTAIKSAGAAPSNGAKFLVAKINLAGCVLRDFVAPYQPASILVQSKRNRILIPFVSEAWIGPKRAAPGLANAAYSVSAASASTTSTASTSSSLEAAMFSKIRAVGGNIAPDRIISKRPANANPTSYPKSRNLPISSSLALLRMQAYSAHIIAGEIYAEDGLSFMASGGDVCAAQRIASKSNITAIIATKRKAGSFQQGGHIRQSPTSDTAAILFYAGVDNSDAAQCNIPVISASLNINGKFYAGATTTTSGTLTASSLGNITNIIVKENRAPEAIQGEAFVASGAALKAKLQAAGNATSFLAHDPQSP
ncbi:MAG: hypothetical protein NTX50_10240 [Candidatus Sumerlaeota bacterium]|nr:hypothetical protein [Candidatus Sumerlaeota bacterium]